MPEILVSGMHCAHCSAAVEKALRAVPAIATVQVDLAAGKVQYTVQPGQSVDVTTLKNAVRDAGFDAH